MSGIAGVSRRELVTKYSAGASVVVRYDPADPKRAALETASAGWRQVLGGGFFIAVPFFVVGSYSGSGPDLPPEVLEQLNKPN
ncbi:MAG: DUF3592 domain-containing protein [Methyloceanibacter sp.]